VDSFSKVQTAGREAASATYRRSGSDKCVSVQCSSYSHFVLLSVGTCCSCLVKCCVTTLESRHIVQNEKSYATF
jgi:hypothetical protein